MEETETSRLIRSIKAEVCLAQWELIIKLLWDMQAENPRALLFAM